MSTAVAPSSLQNLLAGSPYVGYSYSYPHKTAYRPLQPAIPLHELWTEEPRDALFCYVHIPFCEFRCGFCNLFALSQPREQLVPQYLLAVRRQASVMRDVLRDAKFARLAFGGGTPTFLSTHELTILLNGLESVLGVTPRHISAGIEASPATVDAEKLALLRERGFERISLGVQSFNAHDVGAMGRPQRESDVSRALDLIRDARFSTLNIDLIYGADGQTIESWLESIDIALRWQPEEVYLYPLYVRPLTGLGKLAREWDDFRLAAYRAGRDYLLERGYEQVSMRMFRAPHAPQATGPVYCCQEDGMVGLGCGARAYTQSLHYAWQYAVQPRAIATIVEDFIARDAGSFAQADYGIVLDACEQRRRYLITSLLQVEGLHRPDYEQRFGSDAVNDFCELTELEQAELASIDDLRVRLTSAGLERSDAIGPWLYSPDVRRRMEGFAWH